MSGAVKHSTMRAEHHEEDLLMQFPPLIPAAEVIGRTSALPLVKEPAVFTDMHGRILAWSLPEILPHRIQV